MVDPDKNTVDDFARRLPFAALDGGEQARLLAQVEVADAVVEAVFERVDRFRSLTLA